MTSPTTERAFEDAIEHSLLTRCGYERGSPDHYSPAPRTRHRGPLRLHRRDASRRMESARPASRRPRHRPTPLRRSAGQADRRARAGRRPAARSRGPGRRHQAGVLPSGVGAESRTSGAMRRQPVLFCNGLPVATAELKNPIRGRRCATPRVCPFRGRPRTYSTRSSSPPTGALWTASSRTRSTSSTTCTASCARPRRDQELPAAGRLREGSGPAAEDLRDRGASVPRRGRASRVQVDAALGPELRGEVGDRRERGDQVGRCVRELTVGRNTRDRRGRRRRPGRPRARLRDVEEGREVRP